MNDGLDRESDDLRRSLDALGRSQARWLRDLASTCTGDPRFLDAFRRWHEGLALIRLHLLRTEQRLLHLLLVPELHRPAPGDLGPPPDPTAAWRELDPLVTGYLRSLRLETCYRTVDAPLDPQAEAVTRDAATDLVALAAVAQATAPVFAGLAHRRIDDHRGLDDLAFFHVVCPWRRRGLPALSGALAWLGAVLAENEDV